MTNKAKPPKFAIELMKQNPEGVLAKMFDALGHERMQRTVNGYVLYAAAGALKDIVIILSKRIAELEARPVLTHRGVWAEDRDYSLQSCVTHDGSTWVAIEQAPPGAKPGHHKSWTLIVKRGRDGKDGGR